MNTKIPVTWIVLLGLMSSITLGVLFEESKYDESRFIFGSAHEHASISIRIFGEEFDLTKDELCEIASIFYPDMVNQNEIEETVTLPPWFKARSHLWLDNRVSDEIFLEGIEHLARTGVLNIS